MNDVALGCTVIFYNKNKIRNIFLTFNEFFRSYVMRENSSEINTPPFLLSMAAKEIHLLGEVLQSANIKL